MFRIENDLEKFNFENSMPPENIKPISISLSILNIKKKV